MRYFFSISARIHMKFNDNDVVLALSHRIFKFTSFVQYSCFSFLFHSTNWPFQVFFHLLYMNKTNEKKLGLFSYKNDDEKNGNCGKESLISGFASPLYRKHSLKFVIEFFSVNLNSYFL